MAAKKNPTAHGHGLPNHLNKKSPTLPSPTFGAMYFNTFAGVNEDHGAVHSELLHHPVRVVADSVVADTSRRNVLP